MGLNPGGLIIGHLSIDSRGGAYLELIFGGEEHGYRPGGFMERIHDISFIFQYYPILIMSSKLIGTSHQKNLNKFC